MKQKLAACFKSVFSAEPELMCFAPGRVNLIGEYTDLNGGCVLPCALDMGTYGAFVRRSDGRIRLYSAGFPQNGVLECGLDALRFDSAMGWANYPLGAVWALQDAGFALGGFDMCVCGDLPLGSGLSSSASIDVLTLFALSEMFGLNIPLFDMALLARRAENEYVGVSCGVMDQLASALARPDCALYIDTSSLEYEYAPLDIREYSLIIMNTNKRRALADSKYNQRRGECESALAILQHYADIPCLCALSPARFEELGGLIADGTLYRRARHAVSEQARTENAYRMLCAGDITGFGRLMDESHASLRDDFEVTGPELDALVSAAWALENEGVLGARMTGAGFGGCAVALVRSGAADELENKIGEAYKRATGRSADFYRVSPGGGPHRIFL